MTKQEEVRDTVSDIAILSGELIRSKENTDKIHSKVAKRLLSLNLVVLEENIKNLVSTITDVRFEYSGGLFEGLVSSQTGYVLESATFNRFGELCIVIKNTGNEDLSVYPLDLFNIVLPS